ncbi:hypothetical protein R1flu_013638 [Riccia fluitans]|uniref:Uncharacterized protein n=1 Tax=Riccia fluitans TaxID=41844 RepID=A0ABD1YDZ8_9MARC
MGLQDDDEDEGNARMYIGRTVSKFFKGYGFFRGEVISFNKSRKFFKVKYADGDREELDLSELKAILVDDNAKSVTETPEPKGSTGRKRKRDQPVKNAKGASENGPVPKSEDSVHIAHVLASKVQLFAEKPCENSYPVVKTEVNGVPIVAGKVPPVVSDGIGVPSAIGVLHVNGKVDNHVDVNGTKRPLELAAGVEENHPSSQKKRPRDAASSDVSGLESSSTLQIGEQLLEQGTNIIANQEVMKSSVDAGFSASLPPLPPSAGLAVTTSQAGCRQISGRAQQLTHTGSDQTSVSTPEIRSSIPHVGQHLPANGSGYWAASQPADSFITPDTKSSLASDSQKQVEPVAKDVYSLRALRAISRSLPVQRQVVRSLVEEEFEGTNGNANPEPVVEPEPVVPLKHPLPPSSTCLGDIEHYVADLLQAYSFLRSFSHVLFISPFALEEFVVALASEVVSPMIDCIHVSLLQALRRHLERLAKSGSNSAVFCLRLSDWSLLDNITWPSYLMAYALTQGFLSGHGRSSEVDLVKKDYYKLPTDKKLAFLNFLCDKTLDTDELRTEIARRVALENESELFGPSKLPDGSRRDIISLEGEFDEEFERMTRQKRDALTQKSGMQLLVQGKSLQAGEIKQPERGEDGNLDECALCGMDGVLICCDGCPAAYHSRCVGITKQGLPPGDWFCPECRADSLDSNGVKIPKGVRGGELLFVGPDGQRFFSICGYLLVSEPSLETDSACRYYSPKDIPVFLKYLEHAGRTYAPLQAAVSRLCQLDVNLATTATASAVKTPLSFTPERNKVEPPNVPSSAGEPVVTGGITLSAELRAVKMDASVRPEQCAISPVEKVNQEILRSEGDAALSQVVVERSLACAVVPPADLSEAEGIAGSKTTESVTEGARLIAPELETKAFGHHADVVTPDGTEGNIQLKDELIVPGNLTPEGQPPGTRTTDGFQQTSPELNTEACGQPVDVVTPEGNVSNFQPQDQPVVPEIPTPVGQPVIAGAPDDASHSVQRTSSELKTEASGQPADVVAPEGIERNIQPKDESVVPRNLTPVRPQTNGKVVPRQLDGYFSSLTQINASAYINKYINGDIVFTAATYLAALAGNSDDAADDKAGSQKKLKPLSAADQLKAFSQAAPTFFWPSLKKKVLDAPKEKCGWCINCRTTNRKGCLLTQVTGQISGGAAGVPGGIKPVKGAGGHYAAVAAYMLYMEEQLQGLLAGPWEVVGYRKLWRKRVEMGRSIGDVRRALLEMESSLRKIALTSDWEKLVEDAPPLVSEYVISFVGPGASSSKKFVPKRRGRPPAVSKNPPVFAYDGACFGVKWFRGGPLSRQVYNWESLPRKSLRKAARQGGLKEISDLICTKSTELPRKTLQFAWKARTEKVSAVAQLAVQVRCLDKYIKWSEIKSPLEESSDQSGKASADKKMSEAEIVSRTEEEGVVKYLLSFAKDADDTNDSIHQQSDMLTKAPIGSNGICAEKVTPAGIKGGNEQWYLEQDLPLYLVKDFEKKRRKTEQSKMQKSLRARKGQVTAAQKEPSFWDKITDPDRYEPQKTLLSESHQCQRCTENFHTSCTEVEETIDGSDQVAVCKNCAKLRLGQRNRKPSYKMRSLQSRNGEGSFDGTNGDGEDVCGSTPKSLAKKKDKGHSVATQSTPVSEFTLSGKRKAGSRKNGMVEKSDPSAEPEEEAGSSHLQPDESAKGGRSKSGRKSKNLRAVELHTSPDRIPTERRTSSRIRNSMSPNKNTPAVMQDQSAVKKRFPLKRKMTLRGDSAQTEAESSEDEFEFPNMEKKKSPQKRKRLKVLLQGLPLTVDDADTNQLPNDENHVIQKRKKANNGLQYVHRKTKTDAEVARFRAENLLFVGHVGIDPATRPRCSLCSEGYDPAYSFICCEWCQAWYHGDAIGLTLEDASILTGFKCHKCRKCKAPSCPVSSTRQRRSTSKGRRRGVDYGEVIDADSANRNAQSAWRYPLEKDFIGFDDTKDFVAATNQAEEALAVDGSNFGHSLTGTVFELGSGLMTDLEHQIQLTTPLSSLGEHNVNLWASSSGSG